MSWSTRPSPRSPTNLPLKGESGVSVKALVDAVKNRGEDDRLALGRLCAAGRCLVAGTATKQAKLYAVPTELTREVSAW